MAKTKEQKKEVVEKIEATLKNAASAVLVHFKGINVAQETTMRRGFRSDGLGYTVAKKSLIRRALTSLGHDHANMPLEGEIAIAYNTTQDGDPTLAARRVHGFGKDFGPEKLTILGGLFEGALVDASAMREIATIPSMQALRGMFAQLVNSPRVRFAVVLSKVAEGKA